MSMSLDGYIAGPNDEPGNPGGDGFDRLHEWITTPDGEYGRPCGPAGELFDEISRPARCGRVGVPWSRSITGAVIIITVFRSSCPVTGRPARRSRISVGDVRDRWDRQRDAQAKAAAGDRNALVHGVYTAQRALEAGVLDDLVIHQVPVLFGRGRRQFEVLPSRVELETFG